jgi:ADP-heptose:LPS heptosyltransferase
VGVLEGLSLPALAALLSMANLYIGNDSGVTHLAAATGAPVVAVFGPTNPVVWGPRGPEISVYEDSWSAEEILAPLPSERARLSVDALSSIIRRKLETPGGRG